MCVLEKKFLQKGLLVENGSNFPFNLEMHIICIYVIWFLDVWLITLYSDTFESDNQRKINSNFFYLNC